MADRPEIEVRHARSEEARPAVDVLAQAFADEALFSYLLRGEREQRVHALRPFVAGIMRGHLRFGEIHCALLGSRIVGVGIRIPPGHFPFGPMDTLRVMGHALSGFARMCFARPGARRLPSAVAEMEKAHPRERNYWYLAFVGVDPRFRRQGIATALARFVTRRADAHSAPSYLDTFGAHTKHLYEGFGFQVHEEVRPFADGPAGWGLWRPAHPRQTVASSSEPT